ncbi:MAG: cytochrome c3 family protein [Acidobacteriota bacterium]
MRSLRESGRDFLYYSRFILPVALAAILLTVFGVGWFTQPDRFALGYAPVQPIPFSHQLHPGTLRIPCAYCHTGVLKSRHAGIPSVQKCMNCHSITKTDSPDIQKLASLYEKGEPLRWARIHLLPDHAYFDHRPHVSSGILCQTCHGEVQTMTRVSQHMSMRMSNCLGCHRDPGYALPGDSKIVNGPEHCNACHR